MAVREDFGRAACSIDLPKRNAECAHACGVRGGVLALTASSALANVRLSTTSADRSGPECCTRVAAASGFSSMLGASAAAGAGTCALTDASTGAATDAPGPVCAAHGCSAVLGALAAVSASMCVSEGAAVGAPLFDPAASVGCACSPGAPDAFAGGPSPNSSMRLWLAAASCRVASTGAGISDAVMASRRVLPAAAGSPVRLRTSSTAIS